MLTEYQKEDIEFTKKMIRKLEEEILNEKKSKTRKELCHSKLRGLK